MDCKQVADKLQKELKEFLSDKKAVIGISGGVDSAVVAALCVNALGAGKVIGIQMPYGEQSTDDGSRLMESLYLLHAKRLEYTQEEQSCWANRDRQLFSLIFLWSFLFSPYLFLSRYSNISYVYPAHCVEIVKCSFHIPASK